MSADRGDHRDSTASAAIMRRIVARTLVQHTGRTLVRRRPLVFPEHHDDGGDFPYDHAYFFPDPPPGFGGILPFLGWLARTVFLGSVLAAASLASYAAFYHAAMPNVAASERLEFDYSPPPPPSSPSPRSQHSVRLLSSGAAAWAMPESEQLAAPCASVDLFARHSAWDAAAAPWREAVLPRPKVRGPRLLRPFQSYYVEVRLALPDSDANKGAGMFVVVTDLVSSNGTHLATSRRSARYPHRTPWIATARQAVWLVPLLAGAAEEVTYVGLSPFRHYVESEELPLRHVRVAVLVPGRHHPADRSDPLRCRFPVEVIGGRVRIGEELGRFQELLREWFFSCLIVGTSAFAATYLAWWHLLRALLRHLRQRYGPADPYDEDGLDGDPPCELDLDGDDDDDGASLGSRREDDDDGVSPTEGIDGGRRGPQSRSRRRQRRRSANAAVVEDDDEDGGNWEDLRRRGSSAGTADRSSDDDSFSTPPQG